MIRLLFLVALLFPAMPVAAQDDPRVTPNPALPVPSQLDLARLLWGTMAALDQANLSGNYSVMRDIGSTSFQVQNSAAQLSDTFRYLREQRIDLSSTFLVAPEFTQPPMMVSADVMRLQGVFGLRPISIQFDIFYQWSAGRWKVYGIGLQPLTLTNVQQ